MLTAAEAERDKWQEDLGMVIMSLPMGRERKLGAVEGVRALRLRADAAEAERDAARAQVDRLERRDGQLRACIRVNFMRNSNTTHAEIDAVIDAALAEVTK